MLLFSSCDKRFKVFTTRTLSNWVLIDIIKRCDYGVFSASKSPALLSINPRLLRFNTVCTFVLRHLLEDGRQPLYGLFSYLVMSYDYDRNKG